jgi:hypothetical protein
MNTAHLVGNVVQEFFLKMTEGALRFPPIRGGALPWMERTVRAMAEAHVRKWVAETNLAG